MTENVTHFTHSKKSTILFILSILVFIFWYLGKAINIYDFIVVGVLFELLWLPMISMLFLLPILSVFFWIKEKNTIRSLYPCSLLVGVATILILIYYE